MEMIYTLFCFKICYNLSHSEAGKRWKSNKFGPILERCFVFAVYVKFSGSQNISVQNLAIMEMIYILFLFLCNILDSYLLLGHHKL